MPFLASDVLQDAARALIDPDHARWSLSEKLGYLNEALREAVVLKPNLSTEAVTLTLVAGPAQTLPDGYTVLADAICNVLTDAPSPAGKVRGDSIRPIPKAGILDQMFPDWRGPSWQAKTVKHVIYDLQTPRIFEVFPANDGTGMIEAVVGQRLPEVEAIGDEDLLASYDGVTVQLDPLYRLAVTNFVVGRCYAKDSGVQANAARAQAYIADFQVAITGRNTAEANTTKEAHGRPT